MAKSKGAKKIRGANGGGKKQKKTPVEKNGKAKPQEVVVEITYDSDSFENHVIDLRGDEEYQSARQEHSDAGSSDFEERSSLKEEALSHSEGSFGNGVSLDADEGATDSEMAGTQSEELIEGMVSNGAVSTQVSDMGDGADGDEGTSLAAVDPLHFIHGQLVWAKFARFPWWPAQVTDERTVPAGTGGDHRSSKDVLVRFFGTYDYGWVDPKVGLSDFSVKLQERSKIRKKALQKGIEEALESRRTGKLPDPFIAVCPQEEWASAQVAGALQGGALDTSSGFIHLSTAAQVVGTLSRFYAGRDDLYLLKINAAKLGDGLRYDNVEGLGEFPHFYGPNGTFCPLPLSAVEASAKVKLESGKHILPFVSTDS